MLSEEDSFDTDLLAVEYNKKVGSKKSKEHPFDEYFKNVIDGRLDKANDLSNGDTVTLIWECNDEKSKEIYGVKLKYEDIEHTVDELQEVSKFDPFDGIEVVFSGIAPNGSADINVTPTAGAAVDFGYEIDKRKGLNLGEKVTVTAVMYYVDNINQYCAEKYGMIPSTLTKEYEVTGIDRYVNSMDDITEDSIELMKNQAQSSYIMLTILDAVRGSKYEDVGISEVVVYSSAE